MKKQSVHDITKVKKLFKCTNFRCGHKEARIVYRPTKSTYCSKCGSLSEIFSPQTRTPKPGEVK